MLIKTLNQLTLIFVLIVLVGCAGPKYDVGISEAAKYWSHQTSPGEIDSADIIRLVKPFLNETGIKYLTAKLLSENREESETATLLLVSVHQILIDAKSNNADSLLALIEASQFHNRANEYSKNSANEAIRYYLDLAAHKSRKH